MIDLHCRNCGNAFSVKNYRRETAHYCSRTCAYTDPARRAKASERLRATPIPGCERTIFQSGHSHSEAARAKMRGQRPNAKPWNKQQPVFISCLTCGTKVQVKPSFQDQKYCSRTCADIGKDRGLTAEQKKIRTSLAYRQWRTSVFERDDYTCQSCGARGGRLNADHIKRFADYPELRLDVSNGRTLCEDCHRDTPTYGNRQQRSA